MEYASMASSAHNSSRLNRFVYRLLLIFALAYPAMPAQADEGGEEEANTPPPALVKTPLPRREKSRVEAEEKSGKTVTATEANKTTSPVAEESAEEATDETEPDLGPRTGDVPDPGPQPMELLNAKVMPGETRRLSWVGSESFSGIALPTPVLVAHGVEKGPVLCLTAAVHGDELNGIEMVRRILYGLKPEKLSGTVIGVPIVNLFGFRRSSRYLPDRRDLNRYFPGSPNGSSASRIAYAFFNDVVSHCDALVDIHTGSFHRTNLPQLRADLEYPEVVKLSEGFGATSVLHSKGTEGALRRAATEAGIPAITLEAGEPMRFQPEEVEFGVKGIRTLLNDLGMVSRISFWGEPQPVYYESVWVRAETGGILFNKVELGQRVDEGDLLGTVTDPITNSRARLKAPASGRILGMALNQVVIPGFAAYRIGIKKSTEEIGKDGEDAEPDTEGDNGGRPEIEEEPDNDTPEETERPD